MYFLSDRQQPGIFEIFRILLRGGEADRTCAWDASVIEVVPVPYGPFVAFLFADPEAPQGLSEHRTCDDTDDQRRSRPTRWLRYLDRRSGKVEAVAGLDDRTILEAVASHDDHRIAVLASRVGETSHRTRRTDVLVLDLDSRSLTHVCALPAGGAQLTWGRDQKGLFFVAPLEPAQGSGAAIFTVDASGGMPKRVSEELPAQSSEVVIGETHAFVLVAEHPHPWLVRLDLVQGYSERVTPLPGQAWSLTANASGCFAFVARSVYDNRVNVWTGVVGEYLQRLTDFSRRLRPTIRTE